MEFALDSALLKERQSRTGEVSHVWECRTLNIHRGVIQWNVPGKAATVDSIEQFVRETVRIEFRPGWLRGFAFGVILHVGGRFADFDAVGKFERLIDRCNKVTGVWQWAVICFDRDKTAIGIHIWKKPTYLHPVYESVLGQLGTAGYESHLFDIETPRLFLRLEKAKWFTPEGLVVLGVALIVSPILRLVRRKPPAIPRRTNDG